MNKKFTISPKAAVYFGEGAALDAGKKFAELGCKKVLAVYGQNIKRLGIANPIVDAIRAEGIAVVTFNGVVPDPSDVICAEGAELGKREGVDGIIAIGGGSAMDCSKGIRILITNPPPLSQYYGSRARIGAVVPLILVNTTVGSGSEVSVAAVISDTSSGKKLAILHPACVPNFTIVDPSVSINVSKKTMTYSSADIVAHTIETITSTYRNPSSDMMAKRAVELAWANIPKIMESDGPNMEAHSELAFAGTIAALAFNDAMIHVGHHIAHTIGAFYHIPHGLCCALVTPTIAEYFCDKMPESMKTFAAGIGVDPNSPNMTQEVGKEIRRMYKYLGYDTCKSLNMDLDKLLTMIPAVHTRVVEPNSTTPFDVTEADLDQIIRKIYEETFE